jgi:hypothetical protein
MSNHPPENPVITSALLDLTRAVRGVPTQMSLVGGQALQSYGVPRTTEDADVLVSREELEPLADWLADRFGWTPLDYDDETEGYVPTDRPVVMLMDDPVLFDVHEQRELIALETPLGLTVELLAAQHPVEQEMIARSAIRIHYAVRVPVAPLGGVLLVKVKAHRNKDTAAIEQTIEHLPADVIQAAVDWASEHDPATTDDLRSIIRAVRVRRTPNGRRPRRSR